MEHTLIQCVQHGRKMYFSEAFIFDLSILLYTPMSMALSYDGGYGNQSTVAVVLFMLSKLIKQGILLSLEDKNRNKFKSSMYHCIGVFSIIFSRACSAFCSFKMGVRAGDCLFIWNHVISRERRVTGYMDDTVYFRYFAILNSEPLHNFWTSTNRTRLQRWYRSCPDLAINFLFSSWESVQTLHFAITMYIIIDRSLYAEHSRNN